MTTGESNITRYPNTILKPRQIEYTRYTLYQALFNGVYDIYNYLKSNPEVNDTIFKVQNSQKKFDDPNSKNAIFYGAFYEEVLENLINFDDRNQDLFVTLSRAYEGARMGVSEKYKTVYTLAGGHLNNALYCIGAPRCYEVEERIIVPKYITAHVNLLVSSDTTDSQIYNRAIIIVNILSALEKYGYTVELDTFAQMKTSKEIVQIFIELKNYTSGLNLSDLYKILFDKTFFRRIIFRILETLPLKDEVWQKYYGEPSEDFLDLKEGDLYFSHPNGMGIKGENLYDDFVTVINNLNLNDIIDIDSVKEEFKEITLKLK